MSDQPVPWKDICALLLWKYATNGMATMTKEEIMLIIETHPATMVLVELNGTGDLRLTAHDQQLNG